MLGAPTYDRTGVRKRHGGAIHTLALRRCTRGLPTIHRGDNVLRLGRSRRPCRTGSSGRGGSDPPGRGPGAGAGPCVFSHAGPAPWGVTPVQISLAGRPPSAAEDAADQFPGQPPVELWSIAEQDRGRLAVAQLTPPRDRPLHHRRDPLPQPASPPDASRSRLETAPQHLRGRLLNVGTELRNGPGITARTGHLAAGQRRLPTRPNGFVDVSTWRSRRAELNREPLSHEEWSG